MIRTNCTYARRAWEVTVFGRIASLDTTEDHHKKSLSLPSVQAAIGIARPHIAGMGQRIVTRPFLAG